MEEFLLWMALAGLNEVGHRWLTSARQVILGGAEVRLSKSTFEPNLVAKATLG